MKKRTAKDEKSNEKVRCYYYHKEALAPEVEQQWACLKEAMRVEVESLSQKVGMLIMLGVIEEEVNRMVGPWGQQKAHRHGQQPGFVRFNGKKIGVMRPRVRGKGAEEVTLESYAGFQQEKTDQPLPIAAEALCQWRLCRSHR